MARIAWIEDDHERISSLVKLLQRDGHIIVPYGSWDEVEQEFAKVCGCDAIILDIMLPPVEEDPYMGLSILKRLREGCEGKNKNIPVVVCSRVANPVVLQELEALGVSAILCKPVLPSELYAAVTEALESAD